MPISPFPDLATVAMVAAAILAMLAISLFHIATHATAPHAVRSWGQSCLVAALGLVLKSLESFSEPGWLQAAGDLLLGAAIILQATALAPFARHGKVIVRTMIAFNLVHLLAALYLAGYAPDPVRRVIATDLIGAAALFAAGLIVWQPSRATYAGLNRVVAGAYGVAGCMFLAQGLMSWHRGSLEVTEVLTVSFVVAALLQVLLPLSLLTISYAHLTGQLATSALLDPLTQAHNRRGLAEAWSMLQARARRGEEGWHVGVILLDIDHFKKLNQAHGHSAGDALLQLVVEVMRGTARRYDTVGRLGGEEFCMLLPGVTIRQAQVVTERVRQRFTALAKDRNGVDVTLSAGITVANAGQSDMEQALDAADQMLYVAKREGRDRARVDPDALRVAAGMAPVPRTGTQDQLGFPLV
jgi:diguanylate cyclase (GGDEF)-like protein